MIKVNRSELDNFLRVSGMHVFSMGIHYAYLTKDNYEGKVKPAGVPVIMIELIEG